jgi:hypothetical protein
VSVFKTFLKISVDVSFYSSGCLALPEALVPVASPPPSGAALVPRSPCLAGASFSDCCSRDSLTLILNLNKELLLLHVVETGSVVHPISYTMGTGSSFPGVKRPGREADHSPTTAEVKKMWIYTSTPPYAFMA